MSKNLATVESTYCSKLLPHLEEIGERLQNPKVSLKDMITHIETLIVPATNTKAKATFLNRLSAKKSKYDIYWLCHNACTAGMLHGTGLVGI